MLLLSILALKGASTLMTERDVSESSFLHNDKMCEICSGVKHGRYFSIFILKFLRLGEALAERSKK